MDQKTRTTTLLDISYSCSNEPVTSLNPSEQPFICNITIKENQKATIFEKCLYNLQRFSGILYLLIASLLFTSTNFLIKQLDIVILDVILVRSIIQLLISIGYFLYKGYQPFTSRYFNLLMFAYSLFATSGTICFFSALSYIPLADLTTIRYTQVIWTALFIFILFRERIRIPLIFACILTLIGVVCVVEPSFIFSKSVNLNETINNNNKRLFGMFIALLCAFSLSISIILNKKLLEKKLHQSLIMFYFILTSFLTLLTIQIYYWMFSKTNNVKFDLTKLYLTNKNFLYAILLATSHFIPMILTQKSIKREHPSIVSIIQACDILFTILFEQLFSTIKLNSLTLIGSILVLTSIFIIGIEKICQDKINKYNSTQEEFQE